MYVLEICSQRHIRALALGSLEGTGEQILHGVVVEKDTAQNSQMPDIVAATDVVEKTWLPALGNLGSVYTSTGEIDQDTFDDWCIEIHGPLKATGVRELSYGREPGERKGHEKAHASPRHVMTIERWVPW